MFREIILHIFRSTRLCVTACGVMHRRCCRPPSAEIHRRLLAVYGEDNVNRTTVNRWDIKLRECEPGRSNIVDQPRSEGRFP